MRIEVTSESGTGEQKAKVLVFNSADELVARVDADIVHKQGCDGGWYPCVELTLAKDSALHV